MEVCTKPSGSTYLSALVVRLGDSLSGISGSLFITFKSLIILKNTRVKTNQATSRLELAIARTIKFWVDQLPPFHKKYASKKSKSNLGSDTTVDY